MLQQLQIWRIQADLRVKNTCTAGLAKRKRVSNVQRRQPQKTDLSILLICLTSRPYILTLALQRPIKPRNWFRLPKGASDPIGSSVIGARNVQ